MTELRKCARCRSETQFKYFTINRKGEYNKTCDKCLIKKRTTKPILPSDPIKQEPHKTTDKETIPIDATDVGALLGLHKYRTNLHEIVMKYWKRISLLDFLDTQSRLIQVGVTCVDTKTSDEKIMDVCEEKHISINFESLADVDTLKNLLDDEDTLDVDNEDITSFCNKQMGIHFEKSALKTYEERFNVKIDSVNNYVKNSFKQDGLYNWFVGGRVDGVIGFDRIIEIKNRKKGFYPCIPLYEILQVYTYMYAMSVKQASLVEMFEGDIKETRFVYSSGFESFALTKLTKFCEFMEEFMNKDDLKEEFMKCKSDDDTEQIEVINELLLEKLDIKHMREAKVTPIKNIITKQMPPICSAYAERAT